MALKVIGTRSLIVYCDCGTEHKLTVNGQGEYKLESNAGKSTAGPKPEKQSGRKRTIFDAPIPGADEEETREDEENEL
jgi:hypothetical protein